MLLSTYERNKSERDTCFLIFIVYYKNIKNPLLLEWPPECRRLYMYCISLFHMRVNPIYATTTIIIIVIIITQGQGPAFSIDGCL